jgi:hypothetical protein|tara:strand:- start:394 stop:744 length:351 start_codon:yes stop_codon:yes gene_type:complete
MARAPKTLENGSKYEKFDADGDGIISDEELKMAEEINRIEFARIQMENQDKREDAQRGMAWFALFGMLLYPFAVVLASVMGLEAAPGVLGDMAPTYFVSVAAIVAAFYGSQAYTSK